jgi:hypothetical protein
LRSALALSCLRRPCLARQETGASARQADNYMVMADGDVDSAVHLFNEMETAEKF